MENGLSNWYDRLRIAPEILLNKTQKEVCYEKDRRREENQSSYSQLDKIESSGDESDDMEVIDNDAYDVDYHDPQQYPDILKKWIDKVLDIDDDPFIDFYGLNPSEKSNSSQSKIVVDPYDDFSNDTINQYNFKWLGPSSQTKLLHGKGSVIFDNGDEITGVWKNGVRHGKFALTFQNKNILSIDGDYKRNHLCGNGGVTYTDGTTVVGEFRDGCLHGLVRVMNSKGCIEWAGRYYMGVRTGIWWQFRNGGGVVTGEVDTNGDFTGDNFIYLYPDLCTCLIGTFKNGDFISGYQASIQKIKKKLGIMEVSAKPINKISLKYQESTTTFICDDYLQMDPYESVTVIVAPSKVGEGDGLFARRDISEGTPVAFYNGIRIPPQEDDENELWEDCSYRIFVNTEGIDDKLDGINDDRDDTNLHQNTDPQVSHSSRNISDRSQERMDIPLELRSTQRYCATLAHKVNHSFNANCDFSGYEHPLYGKIPCVTTVQQVKEGDELTCFYRYSLTDCPEWYSNLWDSMGLPDRLS